MEVVCINDEWSLNAGNFIWRLRLLFMGHPVKENVYTVIDVSIKGSVRYYYLDGFNSSVGYRSDHFRKIEKDFATELLENILEQVKEEELQTV